MIDIRAEEQVDAAFDGMLAAFGHLDVLVNNAAVLMSFIRGEAAERPPFWQVDPGRWRELWDINVTGTWLCCRRAAVEMMRAGRGSIVNVITSGQTRASEQHIPYGPSKAALEAFTPAGAKQLKPHGVRMNALLPGSAVNRRGSSDPSLAPWDVMVPAALYLGSDASARVTGQTIIAEEHNREHGLLPPSSPRPSSGGPPSRGSSACGDSAGLSQRESRTGLPPPPLGEGGGRARLAPTPSLSSTARSPS